MRIRELFEPAKASFLDWEKGTGVTYAHGDVRIGDRDVAIDITFADMGDGIVNIEFQVGGSFELTGKGGASQVFATVIGAVKQFTTDHPKVKIITFTAEEQSRAKMYDTITKRVAKQLGWHVIPYEEMSADPRMKTAMSYGAFLFAIERGEAPEHRQAAQKPQHSEFLPILYVYAYENPELPAIKVKAKSSTAAEKWVIQNIPGYDKEHPMSIFAVKAPPDGRKIIDKGTVPSAPPKPPERVLTPLEQKLKDKLGEGYVNHWGKLKPKFTELERAIMEGGGSLEEYYENNNSSTRNSLANRMQFIAGLHSQSLGRKSGKGHN